MTLIWMTDQSYSDGTGVVTVNNAFAHSVLRANSDRKQRNAKIRKFAREYLEKYPSAKNVYQAIAGNRRRGSEITAEHYINYISFFVKYLVTKILKGSTPAPAFETGRVQWSTQHYSRDRPGRCIGNPSRGRSKRPL